MRQITGESLQFTVSGGSCINEEAIKIARATAEETEDAAASYCTLPAAVSSSDYRTDTCTAMSSGMKIEGVGLFYDDRCNYAEMSGCFARSIEACRLCFIDKEKWRTVYPSERVPDWEECPCCVAENLGVTCATGESSDGTNEGLIIGISVGIAGVIAVACCLSCAFGTTIVRFVSSAESRRTCSEYHMFRALTAAMYMTVDATRFYETFMPLVLTASTQVSKKWYPWFSLVVYARGASHFFFC